MIIFTLRRLDVSADSKMSLAGSPEKQVELAASQEDDEDEDEDDDLQAMMRQFREKEDVKGQPVEAKSSLTLLMDSYSEAGGVRRNR